MRKAWSKMKITSRKWLACFRRWGREGRERENIFLIHNRVVLPLFLSQSYFNCRKRPQRNIIFYDKILLFIKKKIKWIKSSAAGMFRFMTLFKKIKNLSSDTISTRFESEKATKLILHQSWTMKAPVQHCYGSESKPPSKRSPPVGTGRQICSGMTAQRAIKQHFITGEHKLSFKFLWNRTYAHEETIPSNPRLSGSPGQRILNWRRMTGDTS